MPDWSDRAASPEEYLALRAACGLGVRSLAAASAGLEGGLHGVWLRDDGVLIGMGRVIGDGGAFAVLTDIAVTPAHQGQGWGARIIGVLNAWCDAHLPPTCHVSLISAPDAVPLYERHGFVWANGMERYVPERAVPEHGA